MMHMTFYWGIKAVVLFDFCETDSWLSYILTLLSCFLFSAFYQYLENLRIQLMPLSSTRYPPSSSAAFAPLIPKLSTTSAVKAASVLLFGVNAAISYLIMLAVMSFNGGVCIAIVIGLIVGYLVFRSEHDDATTENRYACV